MLSTIAIKTKHIYFQLTSPVNQPALCVAMETLVIQVQNKQKQRAESELLKPEAETKATLLTHK